MNGLEVCEHPTEPAVIHVGHAHTSGLVSNCLLGLLLSADEHDASAMGHGLLDILVSVVNVGQRLLQIDDVDAIALGEDETLHLGVPASGLVPEVNATVK